MHVIDHEIGFFSLNLHQISTGKNNSAGRFSYSLLLPAPSARSELLAADCLGGVRNGRKKAESHCLQTVSTRI